MKALGPSFLSLEVVKNNALFARITISVCEQLGALDVIFSLGIQDCGLDGLVRKGNSLTDQKRQRNNRHTLLPPL